MKYTRLIFFKLPRHPPLPPQIYTAPRLQSTKQTIMSGTFTSFQWTFESSHAQNQAANDLNLHFAEADRKQRQRLAEAANAHKLRAGEIEIATARERIAQFHLNAKGIAGGAGRNGGKGVQALAYRSWTGGIDGERGPGGYNALNPEIHPNEKEIAGGTGRNGGKGVQVGGNGGLGEGIQLTIEEAKAYHRMGGIGGAGGPGGPGGPGGYTALNPKIHPNKREIVGTPRFISPTTIT
ncbi:hypothetical protein B0H19DRAFT_196048 [Mycena capillaripes]|nr:hypothetical protein B0H19DRAFT_196048 [Mycena capillaripes]